MKKIWVLVLILTAASFIPCSEAMASSINGIWRFESGGVYDNDNKIINFIRTSPSRFPIRVEEESGLYYFYIKGTSKKTKEARIIF